MKTMFKVFCVDFIAKIINAGITILLIRAMTNSSYAGYAIITSVANLFNQIAVAAFGKMYIVEYEKLKEKELSLLIIQLIFSIILGIIFIPFQNTVRLNFIVTFMILTTTCLYGFARTIYQQQCNFKKFSIIEITRVFSFAIFIILFYLCVNGKISMRLVIILQSISLMISAIFLVSKNNGIIWKIDKFDFIEIMKCIIEIDQIKLIMYAILTAILAQTDILMLRVLSNDYVVASYACAMKYYGIMLMVLSTMNNILLPTVTQSNDYIKIKNVFKKQDIISMLLFIGIIIAIFIAPIVLPIIDGGKYPESIKVFKILCISIFISFIGSPYNNILIKEKKYGSICKRLIIAIILSVVGNLILVPSFNEIGTAITTLISFAIVNLSSRIHGKIIIKNKLEGVQI